MPNPPLTPYLSLSLSLSLSVSFLMKSEFRILRGSPPNAAVTDERPTDRPRGGGKRHRPVCTLYIYIYIYIYVYVYVYV